MAKVRADEFNSLTPAAASRFLGVSRQSIYTWLSDGTLKGHRVGVVLGIAPGAGEETDVDGEGSESKHRHQAGGDDY